MLLEDILDFSAGPNSTRISSKYPQEMFYTALDVDDDLYQLNIVTGNESLKQNEAFFTLEGDLIISVVKEKACVVSKSNAGKCLTSAFIKCSYDPNMVDPWFICFYINESETFKKEKHIRSGTHGLGYLHITSEVIKQVHIDLPDLEVQKKLGKLYKDSLKQIHLYESKKKLIETNINEIINRNLKMEEK